MHCDKMRLGNYKSSYQNRLCSHVRLESDTQATLRCLKHGRMISAWLCPLAQVIISRNLHPQSQPPCLFMTSLESGRGAGASEVWVSCMCQGKLDTRQALLQPPFSGLRRGADVPIYGPRRPALTSSSDHWAREEIKEKGRGSEMEMNPRSYSGGLKNPIRFHENHPRDGKLTQV